MISHSLETNKIQILKKFPMFVPQMYTHNGATDFVQIINPDSHTSSC